MKVHEGQGRIWLNSLIPKMCPQALLWYQYKIQDRVMSWQVSYNTSHLVRMAASRQQVCCIHSINFVLNTVASVMIRNRRFWTVCNKRKDSGPRTTGTRHGLWWVPAKSRVKTTRLSSEGRFDSRVCKNTLNLVSTLSYTPAIRMILAGQGTNKKIPITRGGCDDWSVKFFHKADSRKALPERTISKQRREVISLSRQDGQMTAESQGSRMTESQFGLCVWWAIE